MQHFDIEKNNLSTEKNSYTSCRYKTSLIVRRVHFFKFAVEVPHCVLYCQLVYQEFRHFDSFLS